MTNEANTPVPELNDDHDLYQKTLSILVGLKEVREGLEAEAQQLLHENSGTFSPRGYTGRAHLVSAIDDAFKTLSVDVRNTAKSNSLSYPDGLS